MTLILLQMKFLVSANAKAYPKNFSISFCFFKFFMNLIYYGVDHLL
ncbi:protein of unknown function (plasmid) [Azospirillum baldaniorum]|uniref:Uncharacterized protein n=1 Tax=Azospirillum baldaniorum TaxID=1064539 RepID=A0A9P1K1Y8_9PROT|nr:protein of unknown function [Azospirillum baldaniorum]